MNASKKARIVLGWSLAITMSVACLGTLAFAGHLARSASGEDEAEMGLTILVKHVESSYARRNGKLCGSSLLTDDHPLGWRRMFSDREIYREQDEAEARADTGFHCLRVDLQAIGTGKDSFTYEVSESGDRFVLRAFRAYLYDPDGALPRFERRGEVRSGKLIIDRKLYRVAPGGPEFNGHPNDSLPRG
jgi:hypothetical protein